MIVQSAIDPKIYNEFKEIATRESCSICQEVFGFKYWIQTEKFTTLRDQVITEAFKKYIEDHKK